MSTTHLPDPAPPQLRPSRFSHLVLQTPRFPEMTAWYKTVLSARPMLENDLVCFLTYDEEHHRVMIGNAHISKKIIQSAHPFHSQRARSSTSANQTAPSSA